MRSRFRARVVWSLFAAAGALAPAAARAQQLHVDLDRDGIRDYVSIQHAPVSAVNIWLSSTDSRRQLVTRRPLLGIAVMDVDGDGHPELLAADASARLHAWRHVGRGRFRPVRPRAHAPSASSRPVRVATDEPAGVPAGVIFSDPSPVGDSTQSVLNPSLERLGLPSPCSLGAGGLLRLTSAEPRAPPVLSAGSLS